MIEKCCWSVFKIIVCHFKKLFFIYYAKENKIQFFYIIFAYTIELKTFRFIFFFSGAILDQRWWHFVYNVRKLFQLKMPLIKALPLYVPGEWSEMSNWRFKKGEICSKYRCLVAYSRFLRVTYKSIGWNTPCTLLENTDYSSLYTCTAKHIVRSNQGRREIVSIKVDYAVVFSTYKRFIASFEKTT